MTLSVTSKTRNFVNGTANDAVPIDASYTELYANDATIATYINSFMFLLTGGNASTGNNTFAGNQTFNGTNSFTGINTFTGRHNIAQTDTTNLTANGDALVDLSTNLLKVYLNGGIKTVVTTDVAPYPTGYRGSALPVWVSNTSLSMVYIASRDSTDVINISKTTSSTLDFSSNGAVNKLDAGTVASSTNYFIYEIVKTDGTLPGLLASTVNENVTGSIALPTGYTIKRQTPWVVRFDGSTHLIPFKAVWQTRNRGKIQYNTPMTYAASSSTVTTGTTNILNAGTAASDTSIAATATYALPNTKFVDFQVVGTNLGGYVYEDGTTNYIGVGGFNSANNLTSAQVVPDVPVSSAFKIGYKSISGGGMSIDVKAYTTEVP